VKCHLVLIVSLICDFSGLPSILAAEELPTPKPHPFGKREHVVQQLNGEREPTSLPAEIQWISEPWYKQRSDENAQMPYLAYLPEKDRVVMSVITHHPTCTAFITSDDQGKTWSERKWFSPDAKGNPQPGIVLGLTNLGGGKLLVYKENVTHGLWRSNDFGKTWKASPGHGPTKKQYGWDPLLVIKNSEGQVTKMFAGSWQPTGVAWGSPEGFYSQGYFRFSMDEGQTWSEPRKVPQWLGVNEICLTQASNGDLVAACRTDYPSRFAHHKLDHYGGLAVSISKDEGKTWSDLNPLYEWGRHHPSMTTMPNGDIVMSYVVRLGYPATHQGFPQFGVEAIVSHDNGQTWDKKHRYILATWVGNITGGSAWFCSVQSTSTVLMPDGTLLTAFGTGFRNLQGAKMCKMDVALVRWRLNPSGSGN
jgi:Neuraminidase (sialidase)